MYKTIQLLQSLSVLVVGDSCIDIFKYGSCNRISPEAPVPVFDYINSVEMPGMASNVYTNLINLKVKCDLIKNTEDLIKIRYIDYKSKQHIMREDIGSKVSPLDFSKITKRDYDALIISDYDKGFITNEIVNKFIKNFNCPIFVDSKKTDLSCYEDCIIKINELESTKVSKYPNNYDLIVTLGENGAKFKGKTIPTKKVSVFDVSGAGDTFMASLVVKYLLDKDMEKAIKFANFCSSIIVAKSGTASILFEDVINEICI